MAKNKDFVPEMLNIVACGLLSSERASTPTPPPVRNLEMSSCRERLRSCSLVCQMNAGGREWQEPAEATDGRRDCGGAATRLPLIDSSGALRR